MWLAREHNIHTKLERTFNISIQKIYQRQPYEGLTWINFGTTYTGWISQAIIIGKISPQRLRVSRRTQSNT